MALEKTDAVILKSFPYGDTSKIARCYTRDYGKISVIAKGVRKSKTLQSGYLEPLNCVEFLFYRNPKRQLQIFSKAEYKYLWRSLKSDIKKITYGFAVVELIDRSVTGEEPHEELFQLLVDVLNAINRCEGNLNLIYWFFVIHLLSLLGFRPHLSHCPRCHGKMESGFFSRVYGELMCKKCYGEAGMSDRISISRHESNSKFDGQGFVVKIRAINILKRLKRANVEKVGQITLNSGDRKEVGGFLNHYLRYHIEGFNQLKSLLVMEKLFTK
ncbi:MAG: DNA repair protein RecO [Candidatus Marinimicrobia bacterium]|nr:DNA repair protein RecO [Candidatus Neomarinimicrobiota bacterium]